MTWISELVNQHSELESPVSFYYWAALTSISATVKDNVWLNRQIYNLYPNIYVMFHADSGLKKGPPVSMAKQLVKSVNNTRIISGRSSIQGILKELGTGYSAPGGNVVTKAVAFICSSELSSSLVDDPVATTILTDLYDRQYNIGEWRSLLKMESFKLEDPTITMLTATNEAHSNAFFEKKDVSGGYFARTFIIYESKENRSNSLLFPLRHDIDYKKSAEYLKLLSKLHGPFAPLATLNKDEYYKHRIVIDDREVYFNNAGLLYEEWYKEFKRNIKENEVKDETGTLNRFGDSVLKVAMLLSLSRAPKLDIDPTSMQEAIDICEQLVGNVRKVTVGRGKKDTGNAERKLIIVEELMVRDNHSISRTQLNKKYYLQGQADEWDECVLSLEAGGRIKIENMGNQIIYRMPEEQYKELKQFYEGKRK
jgi:hypothetical protein